MLAATCTMLEILRSSNFYLICYSVFTMHKEDESQKGNERYSPTRSMCVGSPCAKKASPLFVYFTQNACRNS